MWSCSQQLMQLPYELQYPLVSLSIATSSSLHSFIYCCAIQSSGWKCILSCFSANGSKVRCSSTSNAYAAPVILHSCPLFMPLSCLNQEHLAGNKGKRQWEGFHKQVWCLLLQLYPHHFLVECLSRECSAAFAFVWHLLKKAAECQGPSVPAFENAGWTLTQQLWSSVGKCSKCKF